MTARTKHPKRTKIACQYTEEQWNPVRFLHHVQGEFTCPGCGSILRKGRVFFCDFCAVELGACCHPGSSDTHQSHQREVLGNLCDYLPPIPCGSEGQVRCMCCERMLCVGHCRKADVSSLSLKAWTGDMVAQVVLCPSCKRTLDPSPEREPSQDENRADGSFVDDDELKQFLRRIARQG